MKILSVCTANMLRVPTIQNMMRDIPNIEATFGSMRCLALSVALICGLPSTLHAGDDFFGKWQPYSDPDLWYGPITIQEDSINYESGPKADLVPVRDGGGVFRLINPQGVVFEDCGNQPAEYIAFHALANGMLAVLHYQGDTPPPEPVGEDALQVIKNLEVITNRTCSVAFFTR